MIEAPQREAVAAEKKSTRCWGYRAADNEQGWEGREFSSKEDRDTHPGGPWLDTPHEFNIAKQKMDEEAAGLAAQEIAEKRGIKRKK